MSEEIERKARIEELVAGNVPVKLAKGKLIVLVGSWIIFILIGILAIVDLYGNQAATIAWIASMLAYEFMVPILIMIFVAGAAIALTVWAMIRLLRHHAMGLLKFSMIMMAAVMWVFAIVMIILLPGRWEILFPLIGAIISTVLVILYLTRWKERLELAAGILTISGQVTQEEPHLFFPTYMKVFFIGILGGLASIIALDLYAIMSALDPIIIGIVMVLYAFVTFLYIYINTYFFNAIITAVAYIWYRKKDPKFSDGLAIATYQLPDLALFATFSAIIAVVRMLLRAAAKRSGSQPSWTGGGFRLADGIIGTVWFYVNYFTLPSIVVEDVPATTAIKRSAHRLFDNWVDVLLKEWGVGSVFKSIQFLIILIFAGAGALFGFIMTVVFFPAAQFYVWILPMVLVGLFLFVFISALISKPFLSLLNDLYLTFLFGFIIDKESNFKYENNLPKELNDKLKSFMKSHPAVLRCQNCFSKVPEGSTSCPKCNEPYP